MQVRVSRGRSPGDLPGERFPSATRPGPQIYPDVHVEDKLLSGPSPLCAAALGSALKTTFFIFYANKHTALDPCLLWDGEAIAPPPAHPLGVTPPPLLMVPHTL